VPRLIVDTSVYIATWEGLLPIDLLAQLRHRYVVRQSSVVLSELRRGARTVRLSGLVKELRASMRLVWEPSDGDWWTAGELIRQIGDANDWETNKRREFQNDALIALTARRFGASVATTNRHDFELLARRIPFHLIALG
jgi:predicted nucleic acid-binding protein